MRKDQKIILIDLDRTLINTDRMKSHRKIILRKLGINSDHSNSAYEMAGAAGFFNPINYVRHLSNDPKVRRLISRKFELLFREEKKYNFSGIIGFLKKLSAKYRLVLLSHGHKKFQLKKINQAKLGHFFSRLIITKHSSKIKNLRYFFEKYGKNVLLIDDSVKAIAAARTLGMKVIKIKKGPKNHQYYQNLLNRIADIM